MATLKEKILNDALSIQDEIVKHRRFLHQNAELGLNLPITKKYVIDELVKMGYKPQDCGESGVLAIAGGKKPGKVFLIRADMDALPILEECDVDYKCTNGNMHACGHDMHTSMLLGAAKILKENEENIEGMVKLMFQPAEEILQGAISMVNDGLLENPKVDRAMMIHVFAGFPFPAGKVGILGPGLCSAASDAFQIDIKGKGGHGAMPEKAVDPINVASHIHIALQEILSREVAPAETAVLTIGMIKAGNASNIIPDTCEMMGSIRTFNKDLREFIKSRLVEIVEYTAKTFRAEAKVNFLFGCPSVESDEELFNSTFKDLKDLLGDENALLAKEIMPGGRLAGSEDFSYVSEKVPSVMLGLLAGNSEEGYEFQVHHPKVKFNESILHVGASVYAYVPMKWLIDNK